MKLRLLSLYPDQMNIYADRGNIIFFEQRCAWRGIEFEVTRCGLGESFDPSGFDLIYMGGGQDRDQKVVASDLVETKRDSLHAAKADGAVILAVCGGYQLLGSSYQLAEEEIEGLGLVDLKTVREPGPRLIGPVTIEVDLDGTTRTVAGFENHGGRTYLHGPLLPKNSWLADHLIRLGLEHHHGAGVTLEPLDDAFEDAAHESARSAAVRG